MHAPRRLALIPVALAVLTATGTTAAEASTRVPPARTATVPVAHTANVLALGILQKLGEGALVGVGQHGAGRLLQEIGLGSSTDTQLEAVTKQIAETNRTLATLNASVQDLAKAGNQAAYTNLVAQALPIITSIKYVQNELVAMTTLSAANRKIHATEIESYISANLLDKQEELNERIVGTTGGADNIITASSRAAKDRSRLWTEHSSREVRRVFEYYATYEALLLEMRVELWHAKGTKDRAYIVHQINHVKAQIEHQQSLLKPDLEGGYQHQFVDTKHPHLVWWPLRVKDVIGRWDKPQRDYFEKDIFPKYFASDWDRVGLAPFYWSTLDSYRNHADGTKEYLWPIASCVGCTNYTGYFSAAHRYRPPTVAEVQALIAGSTGKPEDWLRLQASPALTTPFGSFRGIYDANRTQHAHVIWTSEHRTAVNLDNGQVRRNEWAEAPWGVIAVRHANATGYWYR